MGLRAAAAPPPSTIARTPFEIGQVLIQPHSAINQN